MINEKQFDELWERAEAGSHAAKLMAGYPAWRTRRRAAGVAVMALLVAGAALPMLTNGRQEMPSNDYYVAYCNRGDIAPQFWGEMAEELLLS